jgi:hypothetical protein
MEIYLLKAPAFSSGIFNINLGLIYNEASFLYFLLTSAFSYVHFVDHEIPIHEQDVPFISLAFQE